VTRRGGHASGAGSPHYFQCPVWRKSDYRHRPPEHTVVRLGPTRPKKDRALSAMGSRSLDRRYKFECLTCGYIGWTNHKDILDKPLKEGVV